MPTHTTLLTEEFVQERATAIGMYNFIRYLGMGTGPLVGGFLVFNQNYFLDFLPRCNYISIYHFMRTENATFSGCTKAK